jgi:hypothetical protein
MRLFEDVLAPSQLEIPSACAGHSGAADIIVGDPERYHREQMAAVAHIMEILDRVGYQCELAQERLH